MCKSSTPENKASYPNSYALHKDFPEYLEDTIETYYGKSNRLQSRLLPKIIANQTNQRQLFFEGKGCAFPTLQIDYHWDSHSQVDTNNTDYNKFPLVKNHKSLKINITDKDILFTPPSW